MPQSTSFNWKQSINNLQPKSDLNAWTQAFADMVKQNTVNLSLVNVIPSAVFNFQDAIFQTNLLTINAAAQNGFIGISQAFQLSLATSTFSNGAYTVNGIPVTVASITCEPLSIGIGSNILLLTDPTPATGNNENEIINNINLGDSFYNAFSSLQFIISGVQVSNGAPFTFITGVN